MKPNLAISHQATSTVVPTTVSFQASIKPPRCPEHPQIPSRGFRAPKPGGPGKNQARAPSPHPTRERASHPSLSLPAALIPAMLHTHPSGVSTSKRPKKITKRGNGGLHTSTQSAPTEAPLHSMLSHTQGKKHPVIKHKSKLENTSEPLVETSKMFPSSQSLENCFRRHKRQQALPSLQRADSLRIQSQLIGTQLSE